MPATCKEASRGYYCYYDTPDGCDMFKKVMVTTRYGMIAGMIMSTYDVLMYSHATGFGPMLKRYMFHTVPLALMGATFALVANGVQHYRQKDDRLNYFLGGLACGPIAAMYLGSWHGIPIGGLALGVAALVKKESVITGMPIFPDFPYHRNLVNSRKRDYSIVQDPKDEKIAHECGKNKK